MKKIIAVATIAILLAGCNIYKKYEQVEKVPDNLYGQNEQLKYADTTNNIGTLGWREIFKDHYLQNLIDSALVHNTNLRQAHLQVQEMEASLKAAKLAFIPSFSFAPNYNFNMASPTQSQSYNIAISAQWQIDIFGNLTNAKRQTQALTEQAKDYEQATKVELVAAMASLYYQLCLADRELDILKTTDTLWRKGVETQRALMDAGISNSPAVLQLEASLHNVHIQIVDMQTLINSLENAICQLLAETPHHIARQEKYNFAMPEQIGIGLPISILANRPDVRASQRNVEAAYYATCRAYSAMYPNITLGGTFGFGSNNIAITPGQVLINVLAQLTQPVFAQGSLRANLKISKAKQEEAKLAFAQKLLDAGVEVNEALSDCQAAKTKQKIYDKQVNALAEAYSATQELMNNGQATYLEVLTAQESYLSAQLNQSANLYDAACSIISLYVALGGGEK